MISLIMKIELSPKESANSQSSSEFHRESLQAFLTVAQAVFKMEKQTSKHKFEGSYY